MENAGFVHHKRKESIWRLENSRENTDIRVTLVQGAAIGWQLLFLWLLLL